MRKDIVKRIDALLSELTKGEKAIPTFEQFQRKWETMDDLSKSLYTAFAECPELYGEIDQYHRTVFEYIDRMGLVTERHSLKDILDEMEVNTL